RGRPPVEVAGIAAAADRRRACAAERHDQHDPLLDRSRVSNKQPFGQHVRALRRARGVTQDRLAELSKLSADTIRRLEHGAFSPSLETLNKLCGGLGISLTTLFDSFELNDGRERK